MPRSADSPAPIGGRRADVLNQWKIQVLANCTTGRWHI
jgi:hypothetical protein